MTSDDDAPVVLLTGGTSGIGAAAAERLASDGATVGIVGRNADRGSDLADRLSRETDGEVRFHRADLASPANVRSLAATVRAEYDRLDVLANNAGLSSGERIETDEGVERTFAVNHLAPYLLTRELLGALRDAAPSRVVVTASEVHRRGSFPALRDGVPDDPARAAEGDGEYDGLGAYARSKLANVAFTLELADRLDERVDERVTANCFHPGFVPSTGLFRDAGLRTRLLVRLAGLVPGVGDSTATGAERLTRLARDPAYADRGGAYVGSDGPEPPADAARDPDLRDRLWRVSADLVDVDPDWP